jgi:hypothetical protein
VPYPNPTLISVRAVLASLYPSASDARLVASDAGLDPSQIEFSNKSINTWFSIIEYANARDKVGAVVARARQDFPENEQLLHALDGAAAAPAIPDAYDLDDDPGERFDALQYLDLFDRTIENGILNKGLRSLLVPPAIAPVVLGVLAEPADEHNYFLKHAAAGHLGRFLGATGASQDGETVIWGDTSTTAEDDLLQFADRLLGGSATTIAAAQAELGPKLAGRITRLELSTGDLAQPGTAEKLGQFLALWSGLGSHQPQPILCVLVVRSYETYPSVEQSEPTLAAIFKQATGLTVIMPVKLSLCELKHFDGWEQELGKIGRKFDARIYPRFKRQFEQAPFRLRKLREALEELKERIYV